MLKKELERKLEFLEKRVNFLEKILLSKKIEIPNVTDIYKERKMKIDDLLKFVSIRYGLNVEDMLVYNRSMNNTDARSVCVYILKQYFGLTDSDIAEIIKRDRSTVVFTYHKIKQFFYNNEKYGIKDVRIEKIIQIINNYISQAELQH